MADRATFSCENGMVGVVEGADLIVPPVIRFFLPSRETVFSGISCSLVTAYRSLNAHLLQCTALAKCAFALSLTETERGGGGKTSFVVSPQRTFGLAPAQERRKGG